MIRTECINAYPNSTGWICDSIGNQVLKCCKTCELSSVCNKNLAKDTTGKLDLTLVEPDFIRAVAKVREYGMAKYGDRDNWKTVPIEAFRAAAYRHWLAYLSGEEVDSESGLTHLEHCACNLMFLMDKEVQK